MTSSIIIFLEFVGVYLILLWGIYVPFRGGQLYNGPVYCMAIGGYFAAYTSASLHWPFGFAFLGAILLGALCGFVPALAFSRTKGIVTAVASVALIFIIQSVITNLDFLGGAQGMWSLPKVTYLLPLTAVIVLIVAVFVYRLEHSRVGRALEAISTDPDLASTIGINSVWLSIFTLTASSVFGAVSGVIYGFTIRAIAPETFGFSLLLNTMTMLFIGGRYTMWGIFISVPILWGLPLLVPPSIAQYNKMFYGALLVIVLIVRPEGLVTREMLARLKPMRSRARRSPPNRQAPVYTGEGEGAA